MGHDSDIEKEKGSLSNGGPAPESRIFELDSRFVDKAVALQFSCWRREIIRAVCAWKGYPYLYPSAMYIIAVSRFALSSHR